MPDQLDSTLETGYYVYGVVPALEGAPPAVPGIDGSEVRLVRHGEVAAAVSEIELERPPGRRAELLAHNAVVDALSQQGPVIPVRFGSMMVDADSVVEDLLAPDHAHYDDLLRRLRGLHQFRFRATYVQETVLTEVVQQRPDIAELRRRTRDLPEGTLHPDLVKLGELVSGAIESQRTQDADELMEAVSPLALAAHPRPSGGVDGVLDVTLLVEDARTEELEHRLEDLAEAVHERIRLSLTGPMAPYDFVEGEEWA